VPLNSAQIPRHTTHRLLAAALLMSLCACGAMSSSTAPLNDHFITSLAWPAAAAAAHRGGLCSAESRDCDVIVPFISSVGVTAECAAVLLVTGGALLAFDIAAAQDRVDEHHSRPRSAIYRHSTHTHTHTQATVNLPSNCHQHVYAFLAIYGITPRTMN